MNRYLRAFIAKAGWTRLYWDSDCWDRSMEKDLRSWEDELQDAEDALILDSHTRVWGYSFG